MKMKKKKKKPNNMKTEKQTTEKFHVLGTGAQMLAVGAAEVASEGRGQE